MIEPFEYEQKHIKPVISENVTDGALDTSVLDRPIKKLNNFSKVPDFEEYLAKVAPFTKAHQEEGGRVKGSDNNKADFQSEAITQLGSMVSGYDTVEAVEDERNASQRIHAYLDTEVDFTPNFMETTHPIDNVGVDEPVLQPGISFIDSRKNKATRFA